MLAALAEAHRKGVARKPRANASTRPRRKEFVAMGDLLWTGAKCLHGKPLPNKAGQRRASDVGQCPKRHPSVTQRRESRRSKQQFMLPQRPLQSGAKHVQIVDK